jgi:hypothetical protein
VIHTLHATLPADARLVVQSPDVERAINNACKSRSNLESEVERPKLARVEAVPPAIRSPETGH